ncbi:hypothetical protein MU592_04190, partial [Streptococcus pneumoniae]
RLTLNSTIKIRFRLISTLVRQVEVTLRSYNKRLDLVNQVFFLSFIAICDKIVLNDFLHE